MQAGVSLSVMAATVKLIERGETSLMIKNLQLALDEGYEGDVHRFFDFCEIGVI